MVSGRAVEIESNTGGTGNQTVTHVAADQIGHEVNVLQRKRIEQSVLFLELLQLFRSRVATVERRGCGIGGRELHHDEDERDDAEDQGDQYQ